MEAVETVDNEVQQQPAYESIRPTCPGCDTPIFWIDEERPYCRRGALLFWLPERI